MRSDDTPDDDRTTRARIRDAAITLFAEGGVAAALVILAAAMLILVISRTEPSEATRRLSDLRRAQPADATLRNLLGVLNAKLELCASLPVFEWEAGSEGYEECAIAFRRLAEAERQSCSVVLDRLREHLNSRATATPGGAA